MITIVQYVCPNFSLLGHGLVNSVLLPCSEYCIVFGHKGSLMSCRGQVCFTFQEPVI